MIHLNPFLLRKSLKHRWQHTTIKSCICSIPESVIFRQSTSWMWPTSQTWRRCTHLSHSRTAKLAVLTRSAADQLGSVRGHIMLIIRSIISFWLRLQQMYMIQCSNNTSVVSTVQCCSSVSPLCLKQSVLAPVPLRAPLLNSQSALIGQLTHAQASTTNKNRTVLIQFLCAKVATRHTLG